ncbi:hypothetical protein O181_085702, partial [Austropuccinia psidii MF-1]|nr:hypothetical protein [Austropuccinia psidii MF-1]
THQNWHRITPTANPTTKDKKSRPCIYINKKIPSHQIIGHPQESSLLAVTTLLEFPNSIPQLALLSLYNPPTTFAGIQTLNQCLQTDTNTHHNGF